MPPRIVIGALLKSAELDLATQTRGELFGPIWFKQDTPPDDQLPVAHTSGSQPSTLSVTASHIVMSPALSDTMINIPAKKITS
jgi:hypothetical protein